MLKVVSIILTSLVCFSLFLNTMIISYHSVNYEYIVAELCVEKDLKESCCKGSCHLASQFDKAENSKSTSDLNYINSADLMNWFSSEKIQEESTSKFVVNKPNLLLQANVLEGFVSRIFHPPIV